MNRLLLAAAVPFLFGFQAPDAELKNYLQVRKSHGIVESVGVPALETLVGTRIFEIKGIVKGTLRAGGHTMVLLERTDGQTQSIDANSVPDWAVGTEAAARLIVRATRTEENEEIQATLISIAREDDVQPVEAKLMAAVARAANLRHKQYATNRHTSESDRSVVSGKGPTRVWTLPSDEATPYYASFIKHHNPKLSDSESYRIAEGILGFGRRYGVDARLIVAMIICESDFNPKEISHAGAMGLGQLMPDTVQDYGITNPFDSVQNLYGTVREIRGHLDKYQNETGDDFRALELGLAAYNAGEGAVKRHGGIPPYRETQNYVKKVIKLYYKLAGYQ